MRSRFDEKCDNTIGWIRSANHFFFSLFFVSILIFGIKNRGKSFAWVETRGFREIG